MASETEAAVSRIFLADGTMSLPLEDFVASQEKTKTSPRAR